MTLDEFVEQQRDKLTKFQKYWTEMNKVDSEVYPMDVPQDNAGLWDEMLDNFDSDNVLV